MEYFFVAQSVAERSDITKALNLKCDKPELETYLMIMYEGYSIVQFVHIYIMVCS